MLVDLGCPSEGVLFREEEEEDDSAHLFLVKFVNSFFSQVFLSSVMAQQQ
jgi:hypothetical protein